MRLRSPCIQVGQAGILAHHTGLDAGPASRTGPDGAVVGAGRAIFGDPPAELAEAYDHHTLGQLGGRQVVEEGPERSRQLGQKAEMGLELGCVSVIAGLRCVKDPSAEPALEQARDEPQPLTQPTARIPGIRRPGARRRSKPIGRRVGLQGAATDERQQVVAGISRSRANVPAR